MDGLDQDASEVRLANIESAKKRNRQNAKRQVRNRDVRARTRTHVKNARQAIETDPKSAVPVVGKAIRELDRAATKGVLHKKNAARRKSRLMKLLAKSQNTS
jgi:small subunit ribosomal protein S20